MIKKTLVINGVTRNLVLCQDETLATVLREHLLLTGCKIGCGEGHCGACNVIMNGKVTKACIVKMSKVPDNAEITTIEGVGTLSDMHPLQVAWMAHGCAQCGFCTPASSSAPRSCLSRTRTRPASRSATGSTRPATSAAAPATSRWLTPSWTPLRFCAVR